MANPKTKEKELIRSEYLFQLMEALSSSEDVGMCASNKFNFPVVGSKGNEYSVVVTVTIPTGSNKGLDPYDYIGEREAYQMNVEKKIRKAEENERKRQAKIERDRIRREKLEKKEG